MMTRIDVAAGMASVLYRLNTNQISYMIVGSIAGAIYGEPRLTRDIDLVLQTENLSLMSLKAAFPQEEFYVPPEEILSQEMNRRGQVNFLHNSSGLKIDCMFIKKSPHAAVEFSRRREIEILPGIKGWVAAPEDVILKKLVYYREGLSEKHLNDIRGIVANTKVDESYLSEWVRVLQLECEWKLCRVD